MKLTGRIGLVQSRFTSLAILAILSFYSNEYITSEITSVSKTNILLHSYSGLNHDQSVKSRPTFRAKIDDFTKSAIRRKVHSFYIKGELPTLKKVGTKCNK